LRIALTTPKKELFMKRQIGPVLLATLGTTIVLALGACSAQGSKPVGMMVVDPHKVAEAVRVPAGNKVAFETVGAGQITYECRTKAAMADQFEWAFVGPDAPLVDRTGKPAGKYFGPPATWQSNDGSRITGAQLAVSPAGAENIPLQLVKANPASGAGAMQGVTYIQRLATKGGVAPSAVCNATARGQRMIVNYQADYIFWKAN
jgi:Protein of unknown function (DUF3455)